VSGRDIIDLTGRVQGRDGARPPADPVERRSELERRVDQLERDLGQAAVALEVQRRAEEQGERQLGLARRDLDERRARLEQSLEQARALADEFSRLKAEAVELEMARTVVDGEIGRMRSELEREAERYRDLRRECHESALALARIKASLRRVEEEVAVLLVRQESTDGTP
jgi:chromosome segregation ATPase